MNCGKTGALILRLRKEKSLTQARLAESMNISAKTVSKWERGLGCPDVSLLPQLSQLLGAPIEQLLSGDDCPQPPQGGSLRKCRFYVCPVCGNILFSAGAATLSCCGRRLEPLPAQKADDAHRLTLEAVEDEWFLTSPHPMTKTHAILFAALVTGETVSLLRFYPEWELQGRIPRRGHGRLYVCCGQEGLFWQTI